MSPFSVTPVLYCQGSFGGRRRTAFRSRLYFKGSARLLVSKMEILVQVLENPSTDRVIDGKHVPVKNEWNRVRNETSMVIWVLGPCQKKSISNPQRSDFRGDARLRDAIRVGIAGQANQESVLFDWWNHKMGAGSQSDIYENDPQFHIHRKTEKNFSQGQTPRQICSI
jgi:hypothetical protein